MGVLNISLCASLCVTLVVGQSNSSTDNVKVLTFLKGQLVTQSDDGKLGGFMIELLDMIAPLAGINYTIHLQPPRPNLVNLIHAGKGDIAAIDLTITSTREALVDFTSPFASSPLRILTNVNNGLNKVHYLTIANTSFVQILKSSTVPAVQAIWADIQANDGLVPGAMQDEAVEKVLAGTHALVADHFTLQPYIMANPDKLKFNGTCDDILSNAYLGLAVQLGSPLRKPISTAILKLTESGQLQSLLVKYKFV